MRRPVQWVERTADGVRIEIRVTFQGTRAIRWQAWRSDTGQWIYDFEPTAEQWDFLVRKVEDRYRRRAASWDDVIRVRRWRSAAIGTRSPD